MRVHRKTKLLTSLILCLLKKNNGVQLPVDVVFTAGGLAAIFDLAAFWHDMIAPVKKAVNDLKTVTSMRAFTRRPSSFPEPTIFWSAVGS